MAGRKPYATKEQLAHDYLVLKLPIKEIAKKYGYADGTKATRAILERCEIPTRSRRGLDRPRRPHKQMGLHLSPEARQVVYGCLLGDGTLRDHHKYGGNSHLCATHKASHWEYVEWLCKQLGPFYSGTTKRQPAYSEIVHKCEPSYMLRSIYHPDFSELRDRFYPEGKKIVPDGLLEELNPLAIAVWFMDDSCFNKKIKRIQLSTEGFLLNDQQKIISFFLDTWGFKGGISSSTFGYRINFSTTSTEDIRSLLTPHYIPCMYYKLGL